MPPHERLHKTLAIYFPEYAGTSLDVGAGGGRDSMELIRKGWHVDAVDKNNAAVEILDEIAKASDGRLNVLNSSFEKLSLRPDSYDLISSSFALPFCTPENFSRFWAMLIRALKNGGIISVELFGDRDSWKDTLASKMTFLSRPEINKLIETLDVRSLNELEYDGSTFSGEQKHWHFFEVIAQRKAPVAPTVHQ